MRYDDWLFSRGEAEAKSVSDVKASWAVLNTKVKDTVMINDGKK